MVVDVKEIRVFYFEASLETWAAGARETTIADLPGSYVVTYESGDFLYKDVYYVAGENSSGSITIWRKGVPVWFMSYGGSHSEVVIEFLKLALHRATSMKEFHGGRGLPVFSDNHGLTYTNHTTANEFSNFAGEERMYQETERVGWYRYHGMLL
jgi:hypothetical protein